MSDQQLEREEPADAAVAMRDVSMAWKVMVVTSSADCMGNLLDAYGSVDVAFSDLAPRLHECVDEVLGMDVFITGIFADHRGLPRPARVYYYSPCDLVEPYVSTRLFAWTCRLPNSRDTYVIATMSARMYDDGGTPRWSYVGSAAAPTLAAAAVDLVCRLGERMGNGDLLVALTRDLGKWVSLHGYKSRRGECAGLHSAMRALRIAREIT